MIASTPQVTYLFVIYRSDSPGYSAKCTCYSFMDDATEKIEEVI